MAGLFKDPSKHEWLNAEGADEPLRSPMPPRVHDRARRYRHERLRREVAAILLVDPIDIRYATDVANMQVWAAHNPFHHGLLFADRDTVDF